MKKILVTGSSGYIGTHLCAYLAANGFEVTGVDRIVGGTGCHEFIHQDILDTNQIEGDYDTVVHLAALVQVGMSHLCPMEYYRTNVVGTMNVLERLSYKNFIFASTCQVDEPHVYGTSKRIGEIAVRQYCGLNDAFNLTSFLDNSLRTLGLSDLAYNSGIYNKNSLPLDEGGMK